MEFTIKRSEWCRGQGPDNSMLYSSQTEKKCCVGFYCESAGIPIQEFTNVRTIAVLPNSTKNRYGKALNLPIWKSDDLTNFFSKPINSSWAHAVYVINDDESISDDVREQRLTELFAKKDIIVKFED